MARRLVMCTIGFSYAHGGALVADTEAYCVKCKEKRPMKDANEQQLDNGRRAMKGTCEVCGTKMTKFLPNKKD